MDSRMADIYEAGLKFLSPLTPEETYKTIVEEAIKLVNADYGSIILHKKGGLERVYASSALAFQTINRKRGHTYQVFQSGKPLIIGADEVEKIHPEVRKLGVQTTIFSPLSYQGKSIGVLTINSKKVFPETKEVLKVLQFFGSFASLAIRKTQLYDETKKALETRDLFISMAAHEFRTPLTTINGYIQLLQSRKDILPAQEAKWVDELSWEAVRLTHLVNELLEVNRIKSGELQYVWQERSIRQIVERALSSFSFNHPDREIIFKDQLGQNKDTVIGDFDKLLQVISNLLDNAAKFSQPDKSITLELKFKAPDIIIGVKDEGMGISKKDIPKIFEGFYKGHDTTISGMGLGLFLTKDIINQHHGDIKVTSKKGKGTTVTIKLPRVVYE